jgi:hypothetical protein
MNPKGSLTRSARPASRRALALACVMLLLSWEVAMAAQSPPSQDLPQAGTEQEAPKIPPEQLDALVAPIALYPDPLLSQTLVASTYPLEVIQLQQWLEKNKDLKDKALTDAAMKQPWDPSIQAMVVLPDVIKRLAGDIQWATDLGNAFLAQQADVMDAVQRMRKKAQDTGALKTTEQQTVETKVVETKTVVVVEPTSTEVIYVPSYNPTVVYGPPIYPYPPIYYPPPPPPGAYLGAAMITFGIGMAVGAAWGGHYGWGCGWGHSNVNINVDNNFNRNTNINGGNRGGGNSWQHNPEHRGGAPYSNKATANKYGGAARGDSAANRQASARQQVSRQGGNVSSSNRGGAGASNRSAGGSNSIGSRNVSPSSGKNKSAFGGSSGGYSGSSARSSSSRGSSSMGGSGGGRSGGGGGGRRR